MAREKFAASAPVSVETADAVPADPVTVVEMSSVTPETSVIAMVVFGCLVVGDDVVYRKGSLVELTTADFAVQLARGIVKRAE